jgi:hypothetical protein
MMNSIEIKTCLINSAEAYYQFMTEKNLGLQEAALQGIQLHPNSEFITLLLDQRPFDIEAVQFRFAGVTGYQIVKIVEYDSDSKLLLVQPNPEQRRYFDPLQPGNVFVVTDLKFLVKRNRDWFKNNGSDIIFPNSVSELSETYSSIQYFNNLLPSAVQLKALKTIFTKSFSYIWGAPGTGKTQLVLAYAILHYIRNGKKVAILGPTNNAIEQVLFGVLPMLKRSGFESKSVIRLGTPGHKFADQYPDCCEVKGINNRIKEYEKQKKILAKIIISRNFADQIIRWKEGIVQFDGLRLCIEQIKQLKFDFHQIESTYKSASLYIIEQRNTIFILDQEILELEKNKKKVWYKLLKLFIKQTKTDREIFLRNETIRQRKFVLSEINEEHERVRKQLRDSEFQILPKIEEKREILNQINACYLTSKIFKSIFDNYTDDTLFQAKELVQNKIIEIETLSLTGDVLDTHYKNYTTDALRDKIVVIDTKIENLKRITTEERIKSISVIACTLDTYAGRFMNSMMPVDHIFLDEAGYASISKALTLFNHRVPITFLGDHKQLPPVCYLKSEHINEIQQYNDCFTWSRSAIFTEKLFRNSLEENYRFQAIAAGNHFGQMSLAFLSETRRFGSNLSAILNRFVYQQNLTSAQDIQPVQIQFVHASREMPQGHNQNQMEVAKIFVLIQSRLHTKSLAILTPFNNQVSLLGNALPNLRNNQQIMTVHKSQGQEWDTVILSVVETDQPFLMNAPLGQSTVGLHLLNTALSRTRKELIVVCDFRYWQPRNNQMLTALMQAAN